MKIRRATREVFITEDNQEFYDYNEAVAHQTVAEKTARIPEYLKTAEIGGREAARVRNAIIAWETWNAQMDLFSGAAAEPA